VCKCLLIRDCVCKLYYLCGHCIFLLWAYLIKVIPETCHVHYIWYLRFYCYQYLYVLQLFSFIPGSLPNKTDEHVAMVTCLQTENNICEMTFNINITKCWGYYVYQMEKTPTNSSYCVGKLTIDILHSLWSLYGVCYQST
jgi:hypothetical protein